MRTAFVIFKVEDSLFGIDIQHIVSIEKVSEITDLPQMPEFIQGIINIRGSIVPVIDAPKLLFNQDIQINENTRLILTDVNQLTFALRVPRTNEILDIDKEVIKPVNFMGSSVDLLQGTVLQEGRIISIINLEALLSSIQHLDTVRSKIAQITVPSS
jgi:purine-binding chemotaxis protein CheW